MAIVILNWNGWRDTVECISSLLEVDYDCFSLVVWDNGSSDESARHIKHFLSERRIDWLGYEESNSGNGLLSLRELGERTCDFGDSVNNRITGKSGPRICLVEGARNRGFAGGCNGGIELALDVLRSEYVLLLNNDTVARSDFLRRLVAAAEDNPNYGMFGPTILLWTENGRSDTIWTRGGISNFRRYPFLRNADKPKSLSNHIDAEIITCDWVSGAALMFRSGVTWKMLDSSFFFGNEDADFCLTNGEHGWKTCVVPESIIWHKVGASRRKRHRHKLAESLELLSQNMRLYNKHESHRLAILPMITLQFIALTLRTTIRDLESKLR